MDWASVISAMTSVALRKESVDRNRHHSLNLPSSPMSLSARRAWIEICIPNRRLKKDLLSLSARRAWIEIDGAYLVDSIDYSRSPQGERG